VERGSDRWVSLFNGRDLTGWKSFGDREGIGPPWRVSNACLIGEPQISGNRMGTERSDFANFHLRIEARLTSGRTGWAIIRASDDHTTPHYRIPMDHAEINMVAKNKNGKSGVKLLHKGEPANLLTLGEWFVHEVVAKDNQITVFVNGKQVLAYTDEARQSMAGAIEIGRPSNGSMEVRKVEILELP